MGVWHHRDGTRTEYGTPLNIVQLWEHAVNFRAHLANLLRRAKRADGFETTDTDGSI